MSNDLVKDLFDRQKAEREAFCGFTEAPERLDEAILDLVGRFPAISHSQVVDLLAPWFPRYVVGPEVVSLIFKHALVEDALAHSLSLPNEWRLVRITESTEYAEECPTCGASGFNSCSDEDPSRPGVHRDLFLQVHVSRLPGAR